MEQIIDIDKLYIIIKKIQRYDSPSLRNRYFKRILLYFKGDIYYIARKYSRYSFLDFDDLRQELSLLLYDIVVNYKVGNKNKINRFRSYVLTSFHNKCYKILSKYKRKRVIPFNKIVSLDSKIETKSGINSDLTLYDVIPDHRNLFKQIADRDFVNQLRRRVNKQYQPIIDKMLLGIYKNSELSKEVLINNKKVSTEYINKIIRSKILPEAVRLLVE